MAQAETIKFKTIILIILGLIVPLWPISLPLFWWLAYKSTKEGVDDVGTDLDELKKAHDLLQAGAISQEEFDAIKAKHSTSVGGSGDARPAG